MSHRQKSKNVLSPQRQDYDQFDSMDPPGKPEAEEPGAVALEHSQRSRKSSLRTWESFDDSSGGQVEEGHKREKEKGKKGVLNKMKKGWKNLRKGSDHGNKKDESNMDEEDEQSESVHDEPQEILKQIGEIQLSSDDKGLQMGSRGESRSDISELSRQVHDLQQFKDIESRASQLEEEKIKLKEEEERLKNEVSMKHTELTKKEDELLRFRVKVSDFEADNKALNENLATCERKFKQTQGELTKTKILLDQVKDDVRVKENELKCIQIECDGLKQKEHELSQGMVAMKTHVDNMEEKLRSKEAELKKWTEEAYSISKEKNEIMLKFHDASTREKSLEKEKVELKERIQTLKNQLQQMMKFEQVVKKQSREHETLQMSAKQWESELKESRARLVKERKLLAEVQFVLDEKKSELQQMEDKCVKYKVKSESLQAHSKQLEIQLEKLKQENQNLSQKLEQEEIKWSVKHTEEMQVVLKNNTELKQQLQEIFGKYEALEQTFTYAKMKTEGIVSISERNPVEFAQDLQLKSTDVRLSGQPMKKQKSMELLSESSIQARPSMSMHSSAPSSLTKECIEDRKTRQEVTASNPKCEEEEDSQPYESPHTSLTEVVHRVTVAEENMTDAVKLNIQQEVALLQQKVHQLQEVNEIFQSELEAMTIERNKLNKIKEKYFCLVSERAAIFQKVAETDPQNSTTCKQKVVHEDSGADECLAELNIHQAMKGISIGRNLHDKEAETDELEGLSQPAFVHSKSKDKLDKMTPLLEEHADLKEVAETYKVELTSMKKALTRVESEHSDMSLEKDGLRIEITRLEEEYLQLESKVAKIKEESEFWRKKYENEGTVSRTAVENVELRMNLQKIEMKELEQKLSRKEVEVQTVNDCRKKLEDQLLILKQERDRQHDQITNLLAIKSNLKQELSRYDSYAQDLGAFKEQSQQFKKTLSMKISEVENLKEEKAALQEEIKSMGEEIETRKLEVSFIKKDFGEERKDREHMASQIDNLKAKWKIAEEKLKDSQEEFEKEKQQKMYLEAQFEKARETWKLQKKNYEMQRQNNEIDISALTNQVEELRTKTEEQSVQIDQTKKEYDAKLMVLESRLLKEKQQHECTLKDLNRVTEVHQSSKQDLVSKLADASAINEQLEDNVAVLTADKASIQEELKHLQEEMHAKLSKYESERITNEKNLSQICEYSEQLQETVHTLQSEKAALLEEKNKLVSMQVEARKLHEKERQDLLNRLKAIDAVRKVMKNQYDEEKLKADEASENYSRLSRDLRTKEQAIVQREQNVQILLEQLQSCKCKVEDLEEVNLKLKWENKQLLSKTAQSDEPTENYRRLYQEKMEIEQQRVEYEKKYDALMDDYRELRQFAQQKGLQVPRRKAKDPHQFSHPPGQPKPYDVRPFVHEAHQRHHRTDFVSGHGPAYPAYPEHAMQHSQFPAEEPETHSPSAARVGHGSQDPSNVSRIRDIIQENELIQNIDDDIVEAAADMEERVVDTSLVPDDDARPLDSNLICPLCGKQFRIGQIQHYRHHVDNCTNK